MEFIFHEKQIGLLCAQHCLNALLQGPYFNPIQLAEIAQGLDDYEKQQMAVRGILTREYQQFLKEPSCNYDDSGFFSIQVLQKALEVWDLELVPFTSSEPVSRRAQKDPSSMNAFICNFKEHWFTIRKIAHSWFNLNSMKSGPEIVSNTYLSLFLTTLQHEGYSVFVVSGALPSCEAEQHLALIPPEKLVPLRPANSKSTDKNNPFEKDLKRAIEESKQVHEAACSSSSQSVPVVQTPNADEIRKLRLKFLEKK